MKIRLIKGKTIITVVFLSVMVLSCSKDDPTPAELLTGTWNSGTITIVPSIGTTPLAVWLNVSAGLSSTEALLYTTMFNTIAQSTFTGTLEFRADNTFTWTMTGRTESGTWSISGDGTELTLTSPLSVIDISDTVNITELTESSLKLNINASVNQDITNDGVAENINIVADLSFTKK